MTNNVFFISGIDTGIGKTYATGLLARALAKRGKHVITQKLVQTGCTEVSEDIETHRRLQGVPFTQEDKDGVTCPYIFAYPCSPHMAAAREHRTIDFATLDAYTHTLAQRYGVVLLEGAGGLMVPLHERILTIDYVATRHYPLILVTCGRLGSLNHTLLSIEACQTRGIPIAALIYNEYPVEDTEIQQNSLHYLQQRYPDLPVLLLPPADKDEIDPHTLPDILL